MNSPLMNHLPGKSSFLVAAVLLIGLCELACTSRVVRREYTEVRSDSSKTGIYAATTEEPEDEKLDYRAYSYYVNGLLHEGMGDIYQAAKAYMKAWHQFPESNEIGFSYANALYRLREIEKALDVLRKLDKRDIEILILQARCYQDLGMIDSIGAVYVQLVAVDPDNAAAYSYLASHYRRANDLDSTIWAYQNLTRLRPSNYRNLNEFAKLLAQRQDYAEAASVFRRSFEVERTPANIRAVIGLGELFVMTNQFDSAISALKEGLEIASDNLLLHRELTALYVETDSLEAAVAHARKIVELAPLDQSATRRLGILYFSLDSLRLADSLLSDLVAQGDRNLLNYHYLGRIAGKQEDWEKARDQFIILTQIADTESQSWLDLGYAYKHLKQPDREIETYLTGLNRMQDQKNAIHLSFALGAAYEQSGQIEKAVETFEEIIAHDPTHAPSLNYLGYMLADRGERLDYARQLIVSAVEISPENAAYLDSYGWVAYRMGDYEEALTHLQKAVTLDIDPIIFDHLGDVFQALGREDDARKWWRRALDEKPDNETIKEKLDR